MKSLSILTYNAAIQDIRILGISCYCPVNHIKERLLALPGKLLALDADLICLQELFHSKFQQALYSRLKHKYKYAAGFDHSGLRLRLGSEFLILSKFPLNHLSTQRFNQAATEEIIFTNKGFMHVCITVSESMTVDLINFHATAGGVKAHPEDPVMEKIRSDQINQLISHTSNHAAFVLAGDLNAGPGASLVNYQQIISAGLIDTYQYNTRKKNITWDKDNPLVQSGIASSLPSQRIDHIFVNQNARNILEPKKTRIVLTEKHIKTPSQTNIPLSDHYGVMTTFEYE